MTNVALPKRILVAVDFERASEVALEYALDLADRLDSEVVVLHVFEPPVMAVPAMPWVVTTDIENDLEKASKQALDELIQRHARDERQIRGIIKVGDIRMQIEAVAAEIGADMICMGTHGRSGLARALLGSVAELVVRTSLVPVVTIRADDQDDKAA